MKRRVLVTRPQPAAARTEARLAALGYLPVALPLTEIAALPTAASMLPARFDCVAVTSANAVEHASPELLGAVAGRPCFAVGPRTAESARRAGLAVTETADGDADALAHIVARRLPAGATVAYLCGRVRLSIFEERMREARLVAHPVETYDTRTVGYEAERLAALVGSEPIAAVLIYSAVAAERLSTLPWPPPALEMLGRARFLCISARVASRLAASSPRWRTEVAAEPSESGVLRLLTDATDGPASFPPGTV